MMLQVEYPDGRTTTRDLDTINDCYLLTCLTSAESLTVTSLFQSLRTCSKLSELKNLEDNGFKHLYF